MKKWAIFSTVLVLLLLCSFSTVGAKGIDNPPGVPLYVIIEVDWDGISESGDWTVWGPKWAPEVGTGTILASCTNCLEMSYDFEFKGKTVHFDETYVPTVNATPQTHHVVLHDKDGDGTYTGSLSAAHYFPWKPEPDGSWPILYLDRIDYDITFDEDGSVINFRYLEYEHKKLEQIDNQFAKALNFENDPNGKMEYLYQGSFVVLYLFEKFIFLLPAYLICYKMS